MEIITGVERRRRWRVDEKLRILGELDEPGACFAEVARRHEVSRGLLWNWRRQARSGTLESPASMQFLPVQVMPMEAPSEPLRSTKPLSSRGLSVVADTMIEIGLADGTVVRIGRDASAAALRRVLSVLRG